MSTPETSAAASGASRASGNVARLLLLLGLLITLLIYLDTLAFHFVYDDLTLIVRNPQVHSWRFVPQFFTEHLWASIAQQGNYYRPVFQLWLLLNYTLFGLNPLGWHLLTLAIYLGTTFLVYLLVIRLGGDPLTAAIAAVLFGVHPVHLETVSWMADSVDMLLGLLFLGAFLSYLKVRRQPQQKKWWWTASAGLYALALLTKESAAMLPALVFGYEWIYSENAGAGARWAKLRSACLAALPFLLLTALYALLRLAVLPPFRQPEGLSLRAVFLTTPAVICFYLQKLVWPLGLAVYYDLPPVSYPGLREFLIPTVVSLLALAALAWIIRRGRLAALASLWLLLLMAPALAGLPSFPREELVHDRYLYLASVGFVVLLALGLRWCVRTLPVLRKSLAVVVAVALAAGVLGAATLAQNIYWADDLVLFTRATRIAPRSVHALDQLANALYKRGNAAQALALYRRALELDPASWETYFALGITEFGLGKYADCEQHLQRATELRPDDPAQYYFLAQARINLGNWPAAVQPLERGIALSPQTPGLHYALGMVWSRQGELQRARQQFQAEIQLDPSSAASRLQLQQIQKQLDADQQSAGKPR